MQRGDQVLVGNNLGVMPGTDDELYLFHEGSLYQSYDLFGAHPTEMAGKRGVRFAVWAPNAREVRMAADFNGWDGKNDRFARVQDSGIWTYFREGMREGELYKYEIITREGGRLLKSDPYAFQSELRPQTASVVCSLDGYPWEDQAWQRRKKEPYARPMNIYEVHLGTWKQKPDGSYLSYMELADELVDYIADMGYTHIELMPVAEHPYDRSWGYQATGYYAATSRYGAPKELMYFIDRCHLRDIGVILDWVPGHFVKDESGLRLFDGSPLFEYEDPLKAEKPGWGTLSFDFGKPEVQSFLISNAIFWMDKFHVDGLRVDAVTSMLLLDFDKPDGAWRPNAYGGRENLEAILFLRKLNEAVFARFPCALMMAEESSAWPKVTAPTHEGGLGFNYKWNMGWMNDTLKYMETEPVYRKHHHHLLTFPICYAYSENYALPLSHDEVVHGKKSLLDKMPGNYQEKFAGLRLLLGYHLTCPGKKLMFMGGEFGQFIEWKDEAGLDWLLLDYDMHRKQQVYTRTLNLLYLQEKALWELDHSVDGYEWIDPHDHGQSVIAYMRKGKKHGDKAVVVCNFDRIHYREYRIGVPEPGIYEQLVNSADPAFGGGGSSARQAYRAEQVLWHGRPYSLSLVLPPLTFILLKKAIRQQAGFKAAAAQHETGTDSTGGLS